MIGNILNSNLPSAYLAAHGNAANLPHGVARPLYYADGSPLIDGSLWVDISDPNKPIIREFYAPNSFDLSFDLSFQG